MTVTEEERLAHRRPAQVQVAVAQAGVLADVVGVALDLEGRRLRIGEQLGLGHGDLDLAGRQRRVDRLLVAADDLAAGAQHVLGAQFVGELELLGAGGVRVEDELDDAGAVAEVDEDQAAVVAPSPTLTGATSMVSEPTKAPAPISVPCLRSPS